MKEIISALVFVILSLVIETDAYGRTEPARKKLDWQTCFHLKAGEMAKIYREFNVSRLLEMAKKIPSTTDLGRRNSLTDLKCEEQRKLVQLNVDRRGRRFNTHFSQRKRLGIQNALNSILFDAGIQVEPIDPVIKSVTKSDGTVEEVKLSEDSKVATSVVGFTDQGAYLVAMATQDGRGSGVAFQSLLPIQKPQDDNEAGLRGVLLVPNDSGFDVRVRGYDGYSVELIGYLDDHFSDRCDPIPKWQRANFSFQSGAKSRTEKSQRTSR